MATTAGTWTAWITSGTATTTNAVTLDSTWQNWMTLTCATNAGTSNGIWYTWTTAASTTFGTQPYHQPSAEEVAALREQARVQQEQWAAQQAKLKAAQAAADAKADELLAAFLTPEQAAELERQSAFIVESELGKRYRIKRGWSGNVEELDEAGLAVARYCIHPYENVPHGDNMLAQKFMLEHTERDFLRIANRTPIRQ